MKLISLNCWGGRLCEPLGDFVRQQADSTDAFCFQEVTDNPVGAVHDGKFRSDLFNELQHSLPAHAALFALAFDGVLNSLASVDHPLGFGLATFVKREHSVTLHRDVVVGAAPPQEDVDAFAVKGMPRNIQVTGVSSEQGDFSVANFHGLWIPGYGKKDSPERLVQSRNINAVIEEATDPHIIAGDFNLDPDTESMKILDKGRRNLIKEHDITDTRTKYYKKTSRYADYILVSPNVTVLSFGVPDVAVSDHRPMILEIQSLTP